MINSIMIQSRILILSLIALICVGQVYAQDTLPAALTSQEVYSVHHAAWGISLASGSPNLGRDAGDAMISLLYAYRYAPTNEIELSLNYMPVQRLHELDGRVFPDSLGYLSLSWIADVSFVFQPFGGVFQGIRIGIGPTLTMQSFMMQNNGQSGIIGQYVDSNGVRVFVPLITLPPYPDTYIAQGIGVGANLKLEYLMKLSHNIDFCFRAQLQAFMPTNLLSTSGSGIGVGGSVGSIGGMLRVGW